VSYFSTALGTFTDTLEYYRSLGGFVDPSLSTPRPSTPSFTAPASSSSPSSSTSTVSPSNSTPTKTAPSLSEATTGARAEETTLDLDKEVQNVIAGFGSFWGKVRKQVSLLNTPIECLDVGDTRDGLFGRKWGFEQEPEAERTRRRNRPAQEYISSVSTITYEVGERTSGSAEEDGMELDFSTHSQKSLPRNER